MGNRGNESPSLILLSFIFFFQIIANTIFVTCEEDPGVSVGSSLLTDTPQESCYSSARVLIGPQSPELRGHSGKQTMRQCPRVKGWFFVFITTNVQC